MKKGNSWIDNNIKRIAWLDHYAKPKRVEGAIKLDSNENFILDKNFVAGIAAEAAKHVDLREYPLCQIDNLYTGLAKYAGVSVECVAVGSGSDQIIELLLSTLRGRHATVFSPTFSYFINRCRLHGMKVYQVPLESDFTLDKREFVKTAKRSDIIYICSPNNPTGNQLDRGDIIEVVDSLEDRLVLIDEAYVDFADYSLSSDAIKRNNVIILRTLSKAFGLAGARIGYMISNRKFVKIFRSIIQSPYPISTLSLAIASGILTDIDQVKQTIKSVRNERERVFARLSKIDGIKIFRSDANFIFIEAGKNYYTISKILNSNGIIVKLLGNITSHKGCMRITIGTREMNDKYLQCIEQVI
jgi:histidinol-phosphate aminotransferase